MRIFCRRDRYAAFIDQRHQFPYSGRNAAYWPLGCLDHLSFTAANEYRIVSADLYVSGCSHNFTPELRICGEFRAPHEESAHAVGEMDIAAGRRLGCRVVTAIAPVLRVIPIAGLQFREHPFRIRICKITDRIHEVGAVPEQHGTRAIQRTHDVLHRPDLSAIHNLLLDMAPQRLEASRVIDGKNDAVALGSIHHPVGVRQIGCQGFFAENPLCARIGRIHDQVRVPVVGCRHSYNIETLPRQHFPVIRIEIEPGPFGLPVFSETRKFRLRQIARGRQGRIPQSDQPRRMLNANASTTNHTNAVRCHQLLLSCDA